MSTAGSVQLDRDIRSACRPFKRDRDHREKWSMGMSPSSGVRLNMYTGEAEGGSESQRNKVVPKKRWSQMTSDHKSRQNKVPRACNSRVNYDQTRISGRLTRKADSFFEIQTPHKSLPETYSSITDIYGPIVCDGSNSSTSTSNIGVILDLGCLLEQAEKKWENIQTERMVKDEYEVLDNGGETTVLSRGKGKSKVGQALRDPVVEDDEFILL